MDNALITAIQRFTLEARHLLEREAGEQLEGIYGWKPDGTFADPEHYPAINQIEEAGETRQKLETYTAEEAEVGVNALKARRKLVREAAFTWLNRIVALIMMEERKLLKPVISKLTDSNAYLFWLADEIDPEAYALHERGDTPLNPMGEAPRHIAYRRFLLWQFGELAKDVSVLFDPVTLSTQLYPRPNILKQLIEQMDADNLAQAWGEGNEETIGWVYQAFNKEEKEEVFREFSRGKKVLPEQIAPATQIFTPKWIVQYIVQNSLGRLWVEMHPDSKLKNKLNNYLIHLIKKLNDQ